MKTFSMTLSLLLASKAFGFHYENIGLVGNVKIADQVAELVGSDNMSGRRMENYCSELVPVAEDIVNMLYEMDFDCRCSLSSRYRLQCNSLGKTCCGNFCGGIEWVGEFSSSLDPISEQTCKTYEGILNEKDLTGRKMCHTGYYSFMDISSCEAEIDGQSCNSCEICDNLPWSDGHQFAVADCSSIQGFEFMDYSCEDIDTVEELLTEAKELNLRCEDVVYVRSGGSKMISFKMISVIWAAAAAMVLSWAPLN